MLFVFKYQLALPYFQPKALLMPQEIWKDVPGYEGLYEVSTWGRIRNKKAVMAEKHAKNGYRIIKLSKEDKPFYFNIHRLVAIVHVPNDDKKPEVNHKNGVKWQNYAWNLEWVTKSENLKHSTHVLGNTKGQFKPDDRKIICVTTGVIYPNIFEAAKAFNVSKNTLWCHLYQNKGILKRFELHFSFFHEKKVYEPTEITLKLFIKIELFKRRITQNQLAKKFAISGTHFSRLINGKAKASPSFFTDLQRELNIDKNLLKHLL